MISPQTDPRHGESPAPIPGPEFIARLAQVLPAAALITNPAGRRPYECDGLSAYRELPFAVAIPETQAQLRDVVRACHDANVPIVARGAGTGLSGGALPHARGVLLSLAKFNRILKIDVANRTARVEPGVRNLAISEAAGAHGLYFAPDLQCPHTGTGSSRSGR